jgi:hypothetical protein
MWKHTSIPRPGDKEVEAQGAVTSMRLAASALAGGVSGRCFEECNEAEQIEQRPIDFSSRIAPYAVDAENAGRLWDVALKPA